MARFVLTAQIQLQAPTNTRQVIGQIRNQLGNQPVQIPVTVKGAAQAQTAIQNVTKATNQASSAAEALGRSFGLAVKRFAAFTVASRAVSLFTNSLASAVDQAIQFQREVIKIAQVTGDSDNRLKNLTKTITDLSTGLGVVSADLLAVTRILSQAGVRGRDLEVALEGLAKSTLAPTFDDITQTAEGAVAVLAQFQKGVGALEAQLGSINAVAGAFAVESGDLIGAVRRFGGVFKSAGGELEELLAIFTSVRQTTRESAESISTGLRTIFTRIQRPETIRFLRQLGVELQDAEGRFIGPIKAVEELGKKFSDLEQGDLQFIRIAEELGGFRQIGKVIPLIQQYEVSLEALKVAQDGQDSLARDTAKAQEALAVQITKVKEEFLALVRSIADSSSFQLFTRTALELASALIKVADAVKPLLPLIGGLAAIKFTQGLGGFFAGAGASIRGLQGRNAGGKILGFNRGGFVPGTGNRDTVPAMLQPGEFVIKKSSAQKLGAGTLKAMNENRFASGGVVNVKNSKKYGALVLDGKSGADIAGREPAKLTGTANKYINQLLATERVKTQPTTGELASYTSGLSKQEQIARGIIGKNDAKLTINPRSKFKPSDALVNAFQQDTKRGSRRQRGEELEFSMRGPFPIFGIGSPESVQTDLQQEFAKGARIAIESASQAIFDSDLAEQLSIGPLKFRDGDNFKVDDVLKGAQSTIEGYLLEAVLGAAGDLKVGPDTSGGGIRPDFDFPVITADAKKKLAGLFNPNDDLALLERGDAKRTRDTAITGEGKLVNKIAKDLKREDFTLTQKASGGAISGTDTVPALLTPGEFVVNKKAAQSIGYGNLSAMNRTGVQRFEDGGAVGGVAASGGTVGGVAASGGGFPGGFVGIAAAASVVQVALSELGDTSEEASDSVAAWSIGLKGATDTALQFAAIIFATKETIAFTKSLREAIKAEDAAAKAAADREKQFKRTLIKKERKLTQDAEQKQQTVKGIESEVNRQAGAKLAADKAVQQATTNESNVRARDESQVRFDRAVSRLDQVTAQRDTTVGAQEQRAERIRGLEAKQNVLAQQGNRGTVADPDRQGVRLSTKDVNNELAALRAEYAAQVPVIKSLDAEVSTLNGAVDKQAEINDKATKELQAQGKANLTAEQAAKNRRNAEIQATKQNEKYNRSTSALTREKAQQQRLDRKLSNTQQTLNEIRAKENTISAKLAKQARAASIQFERLALRVNNAGKRAADAVKRVSRALAQSPLGRSRLGRLTGAGVRGIGGVLGAGVRGTGAALGAVGRGIRAIPGVARRGFAAGGNVLTGVGAVAVSVAAVGSAITSGFQEWFKRAEELARKSDDIAGAIEAAGQATLYESIGDVFTIGGFIEAVRDSEGFVERRRQRVETSEFEAAQSFIGPRLQAQLDTIGDRTSTQEDREDTSRKTVEAFARTRSELSDLTPEQRDKALLAFNKQAREAIKSLDTAGVSIDELRSTAINLTGTDQKLRESLLKQVAAIEEARKRQEELNKANLASLQITSAFGAANAAVANFTAGLATGSSSLDGYINTLEQAQRGVGVDANNAINAIEQSLLQTAGGAGAGILADDIQRQAAVARAGAGFAAAAGGAVDNLQLRTNNPDVARQDLKDRLAAVIPADAGEDVKEQFKSIIVANVDAIEGNVATADLSAIIAKISEDSQALSRGFFEAAKLQSQHNKVMTGLYQKREELEGKAAEALNKAIDIQLQAAKDFEDFGGARLTSDQQLSARIAQFNNVGGLAGAGLRTGAASDISRVATELSNTFNNQQNQFVQDIVARGAGAGGPGIFADAGGVSADQREEVRRANAALLQFTQQRIALLKEELSIVQAKNREEKNALDKLITGDIQGFIQGQAAAGAGAALRSGSAGLSSLFSASALGAGFKSLEGQGLSDQQLGRAEQITLQRFGLQSEGILSGTTPEAEALKVQGRELSQVVGDVAAQAAQFDVSEIAVNEATIIATNLTFQNELQSVARRNANFVAPPPPQGLARGGVVYANRGMFVPRGTDTVPAMLTPGEFVVNRSAVQRGNNLQILRAMNSQGAASSPNAKSGGGRVYYNTGGVVEGISSAFQDSLPALRNVFDGFSQAVDRLANTQFSVKLDTTNVNVNLNGASFLASMKEDIKRELLDEVAREIGKAKPNSNGDLELRNTVL
jgi:hypothetical protein